MEDTWGHNELRSSKAKEAVAEPVDKDPFAYYD